ncbi:MAG: CHRD domain-containing protein [Chloroflexi bacterium]|nr:CHRD domain-containing protein [Chloroflexota bacterium]
MRLAPRILAGVALAALVVAPATAGNSNQTYRANLDPLNAGSHTVGAVTYTIPSASGTATVTLKGDNVSVDISVRGVTAGTLHPQHIHAGTTCPDATDDGAIDGVVDGFVDVIEGLPKYGGILVSLDSTINTGAESDLDFPVANSSGAYTYSAEGSRMHIQDEIMTALKLGTRHVVIHGIADSPAMPLPSTVRTLPGLPAWATLPVACGELHRSN